MRSCPCILIAISLFALGCGNDSANGAPSSDPETSSGDTESPPADTVTPDDTGPPPDTETPSDTQPPDPDVPRSGDPWADGCPLDAPDFRMIDVGEVTLNVACQGKGKTIILLHGFPEFWFGWHLVMDELATKYKVIAPDQRGYNLSDKPAEESAYVVTNLIGDILGLIDAVTDEPPLVVGHDWGGVVAWTLASVAGDKLAGLVIANGPHPNVFANELATNPEQQEASGYVKLLISAGSEAVLAADGYEAFSKQVFTDAFSEEERAKYIEAWSQPGAMKAMIDWYRANFEDDGTAGFTGEINVSIPTLVLWGMADTALLPGNIVGLDEYVSDLQIIEFPTATHWIAHDEPVGVADAIDTFMGGLPHDTTTDPPDPPDDGDVVDPPPEEDTAEPPADLPDGLIGKVVDPKPLPEFSAVTNQEKVAVSVEDLKGQWTVVWFYPAANTFG